MEPAEGYLLGTVPAWRRESPGVCKSPGLRVEVLEAIPSRSKPDRGLVKLRYTMRNQNGEEVMTMIALGMVLSRS